MLVNRGQEVDIIEDGLENVLDQRTVDIISHQQRGCKIAGSAEGRNSPDIGAVWWSTIVNRGKGKSHVSSLECVQALLIIRRDDGVEVDVGGRQEFHFDQRTDGTGAECPAIGRLGDPCRPIFRGSSLLPCPAEAGRCGRCAGAWAVYVRNLGLDAGGSLAHVSAD